MLPNCDTLRSLLLVNSACKFKKTEKKLILHCLSQNSFLTKFSIVASPSTDPFAGKIQDIMQKNQLLYKSTPTTADHVKSAHFTAVRKASTPNSIKL